MLVTLAIATLVLLAVFVGVAVGGGLLLLRWQRWGENQHNDLLEALLERDEQQRGGE